MGITDKLKRNLKETFSPEGYDKWGNPTRLDGESDAAFAKRKEDADGSAAATAATSAASTAAVSS